MFSEHTEDWWSNATSSKYFILHRYNEFRINYIKSFTEIQSKRILDIGCGGGILCESLARLGAKVWGFDECQKTITTATHHMSEQGLDINYISNLSAVESEKFDIITMFEILEHVDDYANFAKDIITKYLKPDGIVFISTINRNLHSLIITKFIAEYIANVVPRGIHDFKKFIKPDEILSILRNIGLSTIDITGIKYNPFTQNFTKLKHLPLSMSSNYIGCFKR